MNFILKLLSANSISDLFAGDAKKLNPTSHYYSEGEVEVEYEDNENKSMSDWEVDYWFNGDND